MYRALLIALFTAALSLAADITGKWELRGKTSAGDEARVRLVISEAAGKFSAIIYVEDDSFPVQDMTVTGDEVGFKLVAEDVSYTVKLTLKNGTADGEFSATDGSSGKLSGKKA